MIKKTFLLLFVCIVLLFMGCNKLKPQRVYAIEPIPKGNALLAGNQDGLFWSLDNGDTWKKLDNGIEPGSITLLVVKDSMIFVGIDDTLYRSNSYGNDWVKITEGLDGNCVHAMAISDTILFVGTTKGIYVSSNYGTNWHKESNGLINQYGNGEDIKCMVIAEKDIIACGDKFIFRSYDKGANWYPIKAGIPGDNWISEVVVLNKDIYACAHDGIYLLEDKSYFWSLLYSFEFVHTLAFSKSHDEFTGYNMYAINPAYFYWSPYKGHTWNNMNAFFDTPVYIDRLFTTDGGVFISGVTLGKHDKIFYRTTDNGIHWTKLGKGMPSPSVEKMASITVK
jgi:hypothetical protein